MRSLWGITEPWIEAMKSLQSPAQENTIFGTCVANPQMHKYPNQNKALHFYEKKTKQNNKMHHFFLICFPFPFYKSSLPRSPKWVFPLRYCSIPSFHQQQPDWQSMRDVGLSKLTKKLKGCVYNWMFPWQHGELGTSHDLQVCTDFLTVASAQGAVGWKQESLQLPRASKHLQPSTGQGLLLCTKRLLGGHSLL